MSQKIFGPGDSINEKSTAKYTCTLVDTAGAGIASASVSSLKATLKAADSGTVINSRNAQSVLNTNGGTLDSSGNFALVLGENDTALSGTNKLQERRLTLDVTYTSGRLTHDVTFYVRALDDIS